MSANLTSHRQMPQAALRQFFDSDAMRLLVPFAVVVALWWIVGESKLFPDAFFASPRAVFDRAIDLTRKGILTDYLAASCERLLVGSCLALLIGIPFGYLMGMNRYARKFFMPLVVFFQAVSDIAWLPILVVWFGFSLTSINFILVYSILFPVALSVVAGVDSVRQDLLRAAQTMGASRRQILFEVLLPGSFAFVATGIRTGLGYGWRALIVSEIIIGTSGVGFLMFDARRQNDIAAVIVGMLVLAILWYVVDSLVLAPLERETVERWGLIKKAGSR